MGQIYSGGDKNLLMANDHIVIHFNIIETLTTNTIAKLRLTHNNCCGDLSNILSIEPNQPQ